MTYTKRYEVLEAAAAWMRVCENAGVIAKYKYAEITHEVSDGSLFAAPSKYEFPLALLEGKEVWVGSELYDDLGNMHIAPTTNYGQPMTFTENCKWSWNPPKPATVMVEIPLATAEWYAANKYSKAWQPYFISEACKKALDSLK